MDNAKPAKPAEVVFSGSVRLQYHLYVVQANDRGMADLANGRTIPHAQVDADLRRKWLLGDGL